MSVKTIDIVQAFALGNGDPFFIAYAKKNGHTTLNRFHSDCLGWTTVATLTAKANAAQACPVMLAADHAFLVVA